MQLQELNQDDIMEINGGHNGDMYELGRLVGTILRVGSYLTPLGGRIRRLL